MTRRLIAAILLTLWSTLVISGGAAYFVIRHVLLEELDESILTRALPLLDPAAPADAGTASMPERDRYLLTDANGRPLARSTTTTIPEQRPRVLRRDFTSIAEGGRMRTLVLFQPENKASADPASQGRRLVYSTPADLYDRTLDRLGWSLFLGGVTAGVLSALAVRFVASRALAPMHVAASDLAKVSLHQLHHRVDLDPLPAELRPVGGTLNAMLDALELSVQERERFLADASHELRTPVTALLMALDLSLSRPRGEAEMRDTLERCRRNADALRRIIEQLFDQMHCESDDADRISEVNVASLIAQVIEHHQSAAEARKVRVEMSCNEELAIRSQPHRLRSILSNLVGNAVGHHQGDGWVKVEAQARQGALDLIISDNGPGISPQHQERVFEPFYRVNQERDDPASHAGLGLFLVKSHVRRLQGVCELRSLPGTGTTVKVTVPAAPAATEEAADANG